MSPGWGLATACSRDSGRVLALARQQGSQAGIDALDVVVGERHVEHAVEVLEDVLDVGPRRGWVGPVEVPVGVGGADDPVRAPRDDEEHRRLGAQDQPALGVDAVARDDDVHALGGTHVEAAPAARHRLDVVGPHTGAVDDDGGMHLDALAGLDVLDEGTDDPLAGMQQLDDPGGGQDGRAVGGRRADRHHRVAGIVGLGVVVEQGAGQRIALEGGRDAKKPRCGSAACA